MGCPADLRPDMTVTDLAYAILKNRSKSMHFKELINEILKVKAIPQDNPGRMIAQIHTEINLDARFNHQGGGEWGLREWQKQSGTKVVRIRTGGATPTRIRPELLPDDEDEFSDREDDAIDREEEEDEGTQDYDGDDAYAEDDEDEE